MPRIRRTAAAALAAVLLTLVAPTLASAKRISLNERASLHRVSHSGNTHRFGGTATGTLPGNVTAALKIRLTSISGTVTFYPRGGSITLRVTGAPKSLSRVSGTMTVTAGSGKFAGATGSADFSGTLNRRTWRATVSANGHLTY